MSRRLTFAPALLTAPVKLLLALLSVTSKPVEVIPVVPVTASAPLCVSAPPLCSVRLPLTVEAPSTSALVSRRMTLLPETTETAPVKLLNAVSRVMLLAEPAVMLVEPATDSVRPPCVSAPPIRSVRLPLMVESHSSSALVSRRLTLLAEATETAPVKLLLLLSSVMLLAEPAVMLVRPATLTVPVRLTAPAAATSRLPELLVVMPLPPLIAPPLLRLIEPALLIAALIVKAPLCKVPIVNFE